MRNEARGRTDVPNNGKDAWKDSLSNLGILGGACRIPPSRNSSIHNCFEHELRASQILTQTQPDLGGVEKLLNSYQASVSLSVRREC